VSAMEQGILTLEIRYEHDVVLARQRARQIAGLLGFEAQDQARIATAVSEIARNVFNYAKAGRVQFGLEGKTPPQLLLIQIADQGPGIANLREILAGQYRSATGMGVGILGAKRLMDRVDIETAPGQGTTVRLKKILPRGTSPFTPRHLSTLAEELARQTPQNPFEEIQQQNQELIRALGELKRRQDDLVRLNRELEDTNRGVLALYAELDEKADHLRRADEMKSRFLSNMSHEFRTPLNSMLALARILLDRTDGDLTPEQQKQVGFIRKAAEDLTELVNDLLDLAKVEAGKVTITPIHFEVADLFGALRGMLRPLLLSESVRLVFEEPEGIPTLYGDEGKVSQILRNFISNALKFTINGEIRVKAIHDAAGGIVTLSVADTGIGIAPEDQDRIFTEFQQVEHAIQKRVKGTGLGLPLSRKLSELLQGSILMESAPGVGSTFALRLPVHYRDPGPPAVVEEVVERDPLRLPVLAVEDSPEALLVYETLLRGTEFQVLTATSLQAARHAVRDHRPAAIILDIQLRGEEAWGLLAELKDAPPDEALPVVVVTNVDDEAKALSLGADAYFPKPVERPWLLQTLRMLTRSRRAGSVLIVDDDELARYTLTAALRQTQFEILEAHDGRAGLERARADRPLAIFLDLNMPGLDGFQVLADLKRDPATRDIPVVVSTSQVLSADDRRRLARDGCAVLSKDFGGRPTAREEVFAVLREAGLAVESPTVQRPTGGAASDG
jgi:signal transduction histidine kinase/CheY-like chemotaxis protein